MIDKQIIDGVDVSECECFYTNDSHPERKECINPYCKGLCKDNPNCIYKQLKRKEQECEELKKTNDGILTTIRILAKNNIKLREILTEIKELAVKDIAFCTKCKSDDNDKDCLACIEGGRTLFAKDVLKIINEVQND